MVRYLLISLVAYRQTFPITHNNDSILYLVDFSIDLNIKQADKNVQDSYKSINIMKLADPDFKKTTVHKK